MTSVLNSLTSLQWKEPAWFALGVVVLAASIWRRTRRGEAVAFAPAGLALDLPTSLRQRWLWLPSALQVLGLLSAVVAMARPVHRDPLPLEALGIDMMLCLDASSSMDATDLDPTRDRMTVARDAAAEFLSGRDNDRVGLVRFARYPDLLSPPTLNHEALHGFLKQFEMVERDSAEDRTGIGTAVARAAQVLQVGDADSKVIVLLTDGEENVATAQSPDEIGPLQAAQWCVRAGVRVYTIVAGIGASTASGEWIPLDVSAVTQLAETTGGRCFEARDAAALSEVYAAIDQLEKTQFEAPGFELRERFAGFLIAAAGLMALARLLRHLGLEELP